MINVGQTRLDALEQVEHAVIPRPVRRRVRHFNDATRPLRIRHLIDVAEVRLRSLIQCRDQFIAACVDFFEVAAELMDQAGGSCRGVVDLVHIRVQVGQAGGDSACGPGATDPASVFGDAGGVLQKLLNLRGCAGFLHCHCRSSDHDRVNRH